MSGTVDSRIVTMKFDNAQFAKAAADTLSTLAKLSAATSGLSLLKAGQNISSSLNSADLSPLSTQVEGVSARFVALGTVAVTALANITNKAIDAGLSLANSLTLAPINAGLQEYNTNLNSIQTILANTAASGAKLKDVNAALDELNEYSDQTIYNFSEMAKNIGTFTAAGVDLDTATASIKGIANLAALSGSNSQQAATAMYQLSQAIAAGRVSLADWNSVVNAGMGGAVFQRALADTAVAMGAINEDAVELQGEMKKVVINGQSFRDSISAQSGQPSWLTGEVLTQTLKQFTGDLNKAELAAMGFSDAQIEAIQAQAEMAKNAATKVKTLTQLIDVARETAQSGWAETWRYIFGDFREARRSFTAASTVVNELINNMSDARNQILKDWKELGGRTVLLDSIVNIFKAIKKVVNPVRKAFQDVFPPFTGQRLFEITEGFNRFTKAIKPSVDTMQNLRTIFRAIFGVIKIGVDIVSGLVRSFFSLFGLIAGGSGGVLDFVAAVASVVERLTEWVNQGEYIRKFFDTTIKGREAILKPIIAAISDILSGLAAIVGSGVDVAFDGIVAAAKLLRPVGAKLREIFEGIAEVIDDKIREGLEKAKPIVQAIRDFVVDIANNIGTAGTKIQGLFNFGGTASFTEIRDSIVELLPTVSEAKAEFSSFVDLMVNIGKVIGSVLIAPFALIGRLFQDTSNGAQTVGASVGGSFSTVFDLFGKFVDFFKNVFSELDFQTIVAYFNQVLVLGIYANILLLIRNFRSLSGAFAGFGQDVRGILGQVENNLKSMQNNIRADTIIKIAGAVALLAGSLFILSKLSIEEIGRGLGAIAGVMTALGVLVKVILGGGGAKATDLAKQSAALAAVGAAFVGIATAITILTAAVAILGKLDKKTLEKGLISVGAILLGFTAIAVAIGASKVGVAAGVGMVLIAGALTIMAAALIPFAGAVKLFAGIDLATIANGMGKIALAMVILGAGMVALSAGLIGAVALGVLTAALILFIPQILLLSALGWGKVLKGAGILAAALAIIAGAAFLLAPVTPFLFLLAGAVTALGVGLALAGAGVAAFGVGITTLVSIGGAGMVILAGYIQTILALLPSMAKALAFALVEFAKAIGDASPQIQESATKVIKAFFGTVRANISEFGKTVRELIVEGIDIIRSFIGEFIQLGFDILLALGEGIIRNAGELTEAGVKMLTTLMDSLGDQAKTIANAAFDLLIDFVEAFEDAVRNNSERLGRAGGSLAAAILVGLKDGVTAGIKEFASKVPGGETLTGLAEDFANGVSAGFGAVFKTMPETLSKSLADGESTVSKSADKLGKSALDALTLSLSGVSTVLSDEVTNNPTIKPVLDLTQVTSEAKKIGSMLDISAINANVSYDRASILSRDTEQMREAKFDREEPVERVQINFEQNNTSPKPISAVDSYRGTKNLLSLAKEALANT